MKASTRDANLGSRCGRHERRSLAGLHAAIGITLSRQVPAGIHRVVRARGVHWRMAMMLRRRMIQAGQGVAGLAALLGVMWTPSPVSGQQSGARWVTAWSTSQQALGEDRIANATVRMVSM